MWVKVTQCQLLYSTLITSSGLFKDDSNCLFTESTDCTSLSRKKINANARKIYPAKVQLEWDEDELFWPWRGITSKLNHKKMSWRESIFHSQIKIKGRWLIKLQDALCSSKRCHLFEKLKRVKHENCSSSSLAQRTARNYHHHHHHLHIKPLPLITEQQQSY